MDLLLTLVRDYASVFTAGLKASTHPHGQNEGKARAASTTLELRVAPFL
jgi:hypothetical protein